MSTQTATPASRNSIQPEDEILGVQSASMASGTPYRLSVGSYHSANGTLTNSVAGTRSFPSTSESLVEGASTGSRRQTSSHVIPPDESPEDQDLLVAEPDDIDPSIYHGSYIASARPVKSPSLGPSLHRRASVASRLYSNSRDSHNPEKLDDLANPWRGSPATGSRRNFSTDSFFLRVQQSDQNEPKPILGSSRERPPLLQNGVTSQELERVLRNSFPGSASNPQHLRCRSTVVARLPGESSTSQETGQSRRRTSSTARAFIKEESSEDDSVAILTHFPEFTTDDLPSEPVNATLTRVVQPEGSPTPPKNRDLHRSTFSRSDFQSVELFPYQCVDSMSKERKLLEPVTNNLRILERIQRGTNVSKKRKRPYQKSGYIYLYESAHDAPGHIKIGRSKRTGETRINAWRIKCGMTVDEVKDTYKDSFDWYKIVETLIFYELHNYRKILACNSPRCKRKPLKVDRRQFITKSDNDKESSSDEDSGREEIDDFVHTIQSRPRKGHHTEWFEKCPKEALAILDRWRTWILIHQPYDDDGKLTKYWQYRAERIQNSLKDQKWDRWTQPPWYDYCIFCMWSMRKKVKDVWPKVERHLTRKDIWYWCFSSMVFLLLGWCLGTTMASCAAIIFLIQ